MASPNSTFTEIVTTTLRAHRTTIADNVSDHNALYRWLKKNGGIRKLGGGYEIVEPLDYAENGTYTRYSGYDTLDVSASDVLSAAKYDWAQAAIHVTASGRELRMNAGREQLIDLAAARLKNAMRTAANNMSVDIYSAGSLTNQMGGLQLIVPEAGSGTVGGINATTYPFWGNQFLEATGTPSKSTITGEMQTMWLRCVRGTDKPDLIVSSHDLFSYFWNSLTDLQRYASADKAVAGFQSLMFVDAPVIFDSNTNLATTAEQMYFLNTDYLSLVVHSDADWEVDDEKVSINQDAQVIPVYWMGQLTCRNRSLQGIVFD